MSKLCRLLISVMILAGSNGCGPLPDPRALFSGDLQAPIFLGANTQASTQIKVSFHEDIVADAAAYECTPGIPLSEIISDGSTVLINLAEPMEPGAEYTIFGRVRDASDNSMQFITKLFGFNPAVPDVRINEFTTQGSGKHPDCVELAVLSGGNLAGLVIYEGTDERWSERFVFPAIDVVSGDYVVVHFRPEGAAEEIDETERTDQSGGYDAADSAWDFWVVGGNGLSGNNGAVTVYASPGGPIIDAVLYSNRTSSSDENYRGFGSRDMLEQAEYLVEIGAWIATELFIRPEDALNPDGSTATRSLCRKRGADTDSSTDWYIVPTRGESFGEPNVEDVYEP